jgi:hypothetical protein
MFLATDWRRWYLSFTLCLQMIPLYFSCAVSCQNFVTLGLENLHHMSRHTCNSAKVMCGVDLSVTEPSEYFSSQRRQQCCLHGHDRELPVTSNRTVNIVLTFAVLWLEPILSCCDFLSKTSAVLHWADSYVNPDVLCDSVFLLVQFSVVLMNNTLSNPGVLSDALNKVEPS